MFEAQPTVPHAEPPSGSRGRLEVGVDHVGPGEVVVVVRGGLDVATAGTLRAALTVLLNRGGLDTIGLDLRQVDLLAPAAVGTLVAAQRICQDMGVQLRVTAAGAVGARLLAAATST
jgi:anti-anti-sigma factor